MAFDVVEVNVLQNFVACVDVVGVMFVARVDMMFVRFQDINNPRLKKYIIYIILYKVVGLFCL